MFKDAREEVNSKLIEGVGVFASEFGTSGKTGADPGPKFARKHRDHPFPHANTGVGGVLVVGVDPGLQMLRVAGADRCGSVDAKKGPAQVVAGRGDAGERTSAGSAGEGQQHLLRLIVSSVRGEYDLRLSVGTDLLNCRVSSLASCRFGATRAATAVGRASELRNIHTSNVHRVKSEVPSLPGSLLGNRCRA